MPLSALRKRLKEADDTLTASLRRPRVRFVEKADTTVEQRLEGPILAPVKCGAKGWDMLPMKEGPRWQRRLRRRP